MPGMMEMRKEHAAWQKKYDARAPRPGDLAPDFELDAVMALAVLLARQGYAAEALELAALVEHHPAGGPVARQEAALLIAGLVQQLPEHEVQVLQVRGRTRALDEVLAIYG